MEFERLMLEKDAIFYLSEIVIALEYLHSKVILAIINEYQIIIKLFNIRLNTNA